MLGALEFRLLLDSLSRLLSLGPHRGGAFEGLLNATDLRLNATEQRLDTTERGLDATKQLLNSIKR